MLRNYDEHSGQECSSSSKSEETLNIHVGDISPLTTEFDLIVYFGQFGNVLKANVVKKRSQLYGVVRMASFEAVQKAVNLKAPKICNYYVTIRPFYSKLDAASHKSSFANCNGHSSKLLTLNPGTAKPSSQVIEIDNLNFSNDRKEEE
ncbi:hypothetical protein ACTXT7_009564 [Hymenolepis weldensis]